MSQETSWPFCRKAWAQVAPVQLGFCCDTSFSQFRAQYREQGQVPSSLIVIAYGLVVLVGAAAVVVVAAAAAVVVLAATVPVLGFRPELTLMTVRPT